MNKVFSNGVKQLMQKHNIDEVPCFKYDFVDNEAFLRHIRSTLPPVRIPSKYHFKNIPKIMMKPKDCCRIRPYQLQVVNEVVNSEQGIVEPTLIVMPCGSGKTFTSCCILCRVKRKSLIITNYKIVANQWKRELIKNFTIDESRIQCIFDDTFKFDVNDPPDFTIITYDTLTLISSSASRRFLTGLLLTDFSIIIIDEAHKAVARHYFSIIIRLSGCFLALTATPVREDYDIQLLRQLVYKEKIIFSDTLIQLGYISEILCTTVTVPMAKQFIREKYSMNQLTIANILNPYKMTYLCKLLEKLMGEKKKIMLFCDNIFALKFVSKKIKRLFSNIFGPISMETSLLKREKIIIDFAQCLHGSIICVSRTGDEGLDIPCANTLIQISTTWGSRRQHAQRVGRIQRPFNDENTYCEAITILSENTSEIMYAEKRDEYLRQMKYKVRTIHENNIIIDEGTVKAFINIIKDCENAKKKKKKIPVKTKKSGSINHMILKKRMKI